MGCSVSKVLSSATSDSRHRSLTLETDEPDLRSFASVSCRSVTSELGQHSVKSYSSLNYHHTEHSVMSSSSYHHRRRSFNIENGIPQPQFMAIMRLAHEVIRGALQDLAALLDDGCVREAQLLWRDYYQFSLTHRAMDEGDLRAKGFFRILDEFSSTNLSKELKIIHHQLKTLESQTHRILTGIQVCETNQMRETFHSYRAQTLERIAHEEQLLTPLITVLQTRNTTLQRLIVEEIMPCVRSEKQFVEFAVRMLERHGEGKPRARVFAQAVWACSSPYQWKRRQHYIEGVASRQLFKEIRKCCREPSRTVG